MSTWTIQESTSGKQIGTIQNKLRLVGSTIEAKGTFGNYKIEGNFGNRSFDVKKDGEKVSSCFCSSIRRLYVRIGRFQVAQIEKKSFHLHDTYGLTTYDEADRALMVLFTIIVDEIREH